MITIHNEESYRRAMLELQIIFQTEPEEGTIEHEYFDHLVDAIIEYEDIEHKLTK